MLISVPDSFHYSSLTEGDLIALKRNDSFIGYAVVYSKISGDIILDVDKKIWRAFNELLGESIPFTFDIEV
ncbi:hypothetical protein DFR58_13328 [Anaerobacterium chartisolvens]|uniref:Uncharacterized protein n=1 Tax=Anaerobacterium chartisolvens TaxID=1297424 RepID=A0A369AKF2_9FIRM|nr:hypothetical protein [Anaerobacterium chartisolvens]RCX09889.1 hypothetical protein DFR58_13328 [Anaerobacterium chartisolvens]